MGEQWNCGMGEQQTVEQSSRGATEQFKKESEWYLRGIHSMGYQGKITVTLHDLWMRMYVWDKELQRRHELGTCISEVDATSSSIASKKADEEA